jgi:hypothetical protein
MAVRGFIFLFIFCWLGCHPVKYTYRPAEKKTASGAGQILFITFRIETDTLGKNNITEVNRYLTSGSFKERDESFSNPWSIVVNQIADDSTILKSSRIEHPLHKYRESFSNQQELSWRKITAIKADFFIRIMVMPSTTGIQLDEIQENTKVKSTSFRIVRS